MDMRAEFTNQGPPRAYNAPDLSPIEFLYAVMYATHQPMDIRIKAAKALLPFTTPYPRSVVYGPTIVIGGIPDPDHPVVISQSNSVGGEYSGTMVLPTTPRGRGSLSRITRNHSHFPFRPIIPVTHYLDPQAPPT
jgi:hypothetical protein